MQSNNPLEPVFQVSSQSKQAKYRQIIDHVLAGIERGDIRKNDLLPSINEVCATFRLSRDTVVKAYNHLKEAGVLTSIHGKGYFVKTSHVNRDLNVFILFDVMNGYKERLYAGIRDHVGDRANLDIYFHHFKPLLFHNIIQQALGEYQFYVIMPFPHKLVKQSLQAFDQHKLLMLDIFLDFPGRRCATVSQNFTRQLREALESARPDLLKYNRVILVLREYMKHPGEIKITFLKFCEDYGLNGQIDADLDISQIQKGSAFFIIEDDDLVRIVKYCRIRRLKIGHDVGILSYNDTPFKEIVEDGISVISTDFYNLGKRSAELILNPADVNVLEPTRFIRRNSL